MESISVREAREQISRILDRVQAGEDVLILRRGKPVAKLVRPAPAKVEFQPRASLRDELPPMAESAEVAVRQLRETERF